MIRDTQRNFSWTPQEDEALRELARSGASLDKIAEQMNRSCGSVRIRALRMKIGLAKSGKLKACPAWLELTEGRKAFGFLPERAAVVRNIFEMNAAGLGAYTIAKRLSAMRIPAFGPSSKWDQSTIHNILRNRATVGEYQPKRYDKRPAGSKQYRDRKGSPEGGVISDYYPAVIDEDLFSRAQWARRENLAFRRGRKGSLITNLFAGIPKCAYCGAAVKFHSNGNAKSLVCATVLRGSDCYRKGWSYRSFEESFFRLVGEILLAEVKNHGEQKILAELKASMARASDSESYDARLRLSLALRTAISELRIASAGPKPSERNLGSRITRDMPGRNFEVTFGEGPIRTFSA